MEEEQQAEACELPEPPAIPWAIPGQKSAVERRPLPASPYLQHTCQSSYTQMPVFDWTACLMQHQCASPVVAVHIRAGSAALVQHCNKKSANARVVIALDVKEPNTLQQDSLLPVCCIRDSGFISEFALPYQSSGLWPLDHN